MKTALIVAAAAGLVAAQINYNASTGVYTCAQPNQVYCMGISLQTSFILRCNETAIGLVGNCNVNLAGEPPVGSTYSPCWQTSNVTGDAACSKNCVVYGDSGNHNGTFTLPVEDCTPTYTAISSSATIATTLTQSVTISSSSISTSSGLAPITSIIATTTVCTESESSTASTSAVTNPSLSSVNTSVTSATTIMTPPASSESQSGEGSPPAAGSTASNPSGLGPGPVVTSTSTSTSSVAAVSATPFPTAGAVANHVGVGLGVMGLLVGAML